MVECDDAPDSMEHVHLGLKEWCVYVYVFHDFPRMGYPRVHTTFY